MLDAHEGLMKIAIKLHNLSIIKMLSFNCFKRLNQTESKSCLLLMLWHFANKTGINRDFNVLLFIRVCCIQVYELFDC